MQTAENCKENERKRERERKGMKKEMEMDTLRERSKQDEQRANIQKK